MKKKYIKPITVWMKELSAGNLLQEELIGPLAGSPSHAQGGSGAPARRGAGLDGPAGL